MKVIYWHVYSLEVLHTQKALKSANDIVEKERNFQDGVVVLMALENGDDLKQDLFEKFAQDLKDYLAQINAKKVFVYPYAHLSNNLLRPSLSKELFYKMINYLKESIDYEISYAEFGWYKEFKVHVRGHPLAELSRSF